jgi:hypothetical protein
MRDITLQPIPVLADGGSHEGQLILADGQLVAVFVRVTPEETAGRRRAGFWRQVSVPAAA